MTASVQELKAFLTVEGSLADSYQWRQLQPLQGSVLEGIARLPKQLLGAPSRPAHGLCRLLPSCSPTLRNSASGLLQASGGQGMAQLRSTWWLPSWDCRPAMLGRMHGRVPTRRSECRQAWLCSRQT